MDSLQERTQDMVQGYKPTSASHWAIYKIDTLHKEGKTQKVIAKEAGCSQSSVSKHINREAKGRKICGRKNCTSNRDNRTLNRIVKQNTLKNVGEIHKEWTAAGVNASRTTMHRRMQDMGFSCRIPCVKPLLNNR